MDSSVGYIYKMPGKYSKPIKDFLAGFNYEYKNAKPDTGGSYELTTQGYLEKLNESRLRLLNAKRGQARKLKENYENAKSGIDKKREQIFYPGSNSYNEQTKQVALMQRQLALTRISTGNIDKESFSKEIENNFKSNNIDFNAQIYDYLVSNKSQTIPMDTQLHLISELKKGFSARGLADLKELKEDISDGETSYNELKKTFQL